MVILEGSYLFSLTPITNMGASGDGADTTTRLAPPWMWDYEVDGKRFIGIIWILRIFNAPKWMRLTLTEALSMLRKTPVDSTTYRAPASPHGISAGFILNVRKWQLDYRLYISMLLAHSILTLHRIPTTLMFAERQFYVTFINNSFINNRQFSLHWELKVF